MLRPINKIRDILINATYAQLKELWGAHRGWAVQNGRVSGQPKWFDEPGTLNVIGIRCNTEVDFNFGKYNDFLLLVFNKENDLYDVQLLEVTVDPNHDAYGRGHLAQGVYDAYKVGVHGLSSGNTTSFVKGVGNVTRWALRQDRNKVYVTRTNGGGKVIEREWCMAFINIHDTNKYEDSSIACTVISTLKSWYERFVPYLYDIANKKFACTNHDNLTYCLMNHSQLEIYLEQVIGREERASAESGVTEQTTSEPYAGIGLMKND